MSKWQKKKKLRKIEAFQTKLMFAEPFADDLTGVDDHDKSVGIHLAGVGAQRHCLMPAGGSEDNVALLMAVRPLCHFDGGAALKRFVDVFDNRLRIAGNHGKKFGQVDGFDYHIHHQLL